MRVEVQCLANLFVSHRYTHNGDGTYQDENSPAEQPI